MFVISTIDGKIINFSPNGKDFNDILSIIQNEHSEQLIGTNNYNICNKLISGKKHKAIITNHEIIDFKEIYEKIPKQEKNVNKIKTLKYEKIFQSKQQLTKFLENNPLFYNNEYYSITQEKQALLTSAIAAYQLKVQAGIPAVLKWNTTGDVCREFTFEEITGLVVAITDYIQPRVEKQQALEVQIRNCTSIEELDSIAIDYKEV